MYNFKTGLNIALAISLILLISCEKEQNDSTINTLTTEIGKIETIYQEGSVKIENKASQSFIKVETIADESYQEKIRQELKKSFSKQTTYLKSGSGNVGVLKNGTCGTYQELKILMDCEDGNWSTNGDGWIGNCSIDINGNVTLVCCVVPAVSFKRCGFDYAVLDLNGNALPSGVNGFTRYIDNEDGNNKNKTTLDGNTIGTLGNCIFNTNTTLAFQFYPNDGSNSTTCISYIISPFLKDFGLFGKVRLPFNGNVIHYGSITNDDEDTRNANWSFQPLSPNVPNVDARTNIIADGVNTTFNFTWMHFD